MTFIYQKHSKKKMRNSKFRIQSRRDRHLQRKENVFKKFEDYMLTSKVY